ncbi:MAG TPA: F0F1 ATP synthase subunit delta, partial [Thermopolyspora sp.]
QRLVAVVRSAVPLTEAQRRRLVDWLRTAYGRDIHLNAEVDPKVLGGFSVRVGDEIIDTTIVGRIEEVRRRLTG